MVRQKCRREIDGILEKRLKKEMETFKKEFGEGMTFIDMTMYFAQYSDFNWEKIRKNNGRNL